VRRLGLLSSLYNVAYTIAIPDLAGPQVTWLRGELAPLYTFTKDKRPEAYQARECAVAAADIARALEGKGYSTLAAHLFLSASCALAEIASQIDFADEMMKALETTA